MDIPSGRVAPSPIALDPVKDGNSDPDTSSIDTPVTSGLSDEKHIDDSEPLKRMRVMSILEVDPWGGEVCFDSSLTSSGGITERTPDGEFSHEEKPEGHALDSSPTLKKPIEACWAEYRHNFGFLHQALAGWWEKIPKDRYSCILAPAALGGNEMVGFVWETCYGIAYVLTLLPYPVSNSSISMDPRLSVLRSRLDKLRSLLNEWDILLSDSAGDGNNNSPKAESTTSKQTMPVRQVMDSIQLKVTRLEPRLFSVLMMLESVLSVPSKPIGSLLPHKDLSQYPWVATSGLEFGIAFEKLYQDWVQMRDEVENKVMIPLNSLGNMGYVLSHDQEQCSDKTQIRTLLARSDLLSLSLPTISTKPESKSKDAVSRTSHICDAIWIMFREATTVSPLRLDLLSQLPIPGVIDQATKIVFALALLKNMPAWTIMGRSESNQPPNTLSPAIRNLPILIHTTFVDKALSGALCLFRKLMEHLQTEEPLDNEGILYMMTLICHCLEYIVAMNVSPLLSSIGGLGFWKRQMELGKMSESLFTVIRESTVAAANTRSGDSPKEVESVVLPQVCIPSAWPFQPLYLLCLSDAGALNDDTKSLVLVSERLCQSAFPSRGPC